MHGFCASVAPTRGSGASRRLVVLASAGPVAMPEPSRTVTITPYQDGPNLLRGPFVIRGQDGATIDTTRRVVALCRCGKSKIRPFCDGTHRLVGFQAPGFAEQIGDGELEEQDS